MPKEYLGDSVYVEVVEGGLKLTTENSEEPSNTIWLEKEVFNALVLFTRQEQVREVF